jgi:hypothetical protein
MLGTDFYISELLRKREKIELEVEREGSSDLARNFKITFATLRPYCIRTVDVITNKSLIWMNSCLCVASVGRHLGILCYKLWIAYTDTNNMVKCLLNA